MNRALMSSLILVFVSIAPLSEQKSRRRANRPPSIESFYSSESSVQVCPFALVSVYNQNVALFVKATDPDGDTLSYEYSTTEGVISGKGMSVDWNLDKLPRGPHDVHVTVSDGRGGKAKAVLTVTTRDADICDLPPKPCPLIEVSCPVELAQSKPFIFSVIIKRDVEGVIGPSFVWKTNAGRIVKGQHSREVEISAASAEGFDNITATVNVRGYDPSCTGTEVACTTKILR